MFLGRLSNWNVFCLDRVANPSVFRNKREYKRSTNAALLRELSTTEVTLIMYKAVRLFTLIAGLMLMFAVNVASQVTTAAVTGRVVDGQGNIVPGAKVTAKNRATGIERSVVTNSDGDYLITELAPGRYDLAAEAQSFSRSLIEDL